MNRFDESINTTSNAVELAVRVVSRIAGNLVANTINGVPINNSTLSQVAAAKLQMASGPATDIKFCGVDDPTCESCQ